MAERALVPDPLDVNLLIHRVWQPLYAGDYRDAIVQARRALDLYPNDPAGLLYLGQALVQTGNSREGQDALRRTIQPFKDRSRSEAELAAAYALSGRPSDAGQAVDRLKQRATRAYVSAYSFAIVYAAMGDADTAQVWSDRAYQERSTQLVGRGGADVQPSARASVIYRPREADRPARVVLVARRACRA